MPHQCTSCGRGFADGAEQILSGCPDCGGNTFRFLPGGGRGGGSQDGGDGGEGGGGADGDEGGGGAGGTSPGESEKPGDAASTGVVTTIRDWVTGADGTDGDGSELQSTGAAVDAEPPGGGGADAGPSPAAGGVSDAKSSSPADGTSSAADGGADDDSPSGADDSPSGADDSPSGADGVGDSSPPADADPSSADDAGAEPSPPADAGPPTAGAYGSLAASPAVDDEARVIEDGGTEDSAQAAARTSLPGPGALLGDPVGDGSPADGDNASRRPDAAGGGPGGREPEGADSSGAAEDGAGGPGATRAARRGAAPDVVHEELSCQFEGIRILEPGQYEVNPVELYEREEHVIAVQENGRYVIQMAGSWRDDEPE